MSAKSTQPKYTEAWLRQYVHLAMSILGNVHKSQPRDFSTLEDRMKMIKSILKGKACKALDGKRFGACGLFGDAEYRDPDLRKIVPEGMLKLLAKEHERVSALCRR